MTPTSSSTPTASTNAATEAPTGCIRTSRFCCRRRAAPVRRSWSGCPAAICVANATAIAEYLDIRANRQGRNDSADVVLLRPVGDPQPPAPRRRADPHRSLGRRRGVLDTVPSAPRHLVRRRALHLRNARADRLRRHRSARSALCHPSRRATATRTRAQLCRRSASARAGSCSSCTARRRPPPEWLTCHRNSRSHIPRRSAGPSPVAPSPSSRSKDGPIPTSASWCITAPTS